MKKNYEKTLLSLAMVCMVSFAHAQLFEVLGVDVGYIYIGPKLGGNISYNSNNSPIFGSEKTYNGGYQIGGVGKFGITKKLSIQPELLYTSKGYGIKNTNVGKKLNTNYKYIGLPIVANYAFSLFSEIEVYGSGGFYTDVLTGVNTKTVNTLKKGSSEDPFAAQDFDMLVYEKESIIETSTINELYKRIDFGLSIGAGANIPVNKSDILNIDIRVSHGFTNVEKETPTNFNPSTKSKNTSVQVSATYLYDLTKWVSFKDKKEPDAYEKSITPAVVPERVEPEPTETTPVDDKKIEEENRSFENTNTQEDTE